MIFLSRSEFDIAVKSGAVAADGGYLGDDGIVPQGEQVMQVIDDPELLAEIWRRKKAWEDAIWRRPVGQE